MSSGGRERAGAIGSSISGEAELMLDQVGVVSKTISSLGDVAANIRGSSTVGGSTRRRKGADASRGAVTIQTGTVLAGESKQLVALGSLRNLDAVLVSPLLDLAVRPGIKKCVTETLLSSSGRRRGLSVCILGVQAGKAGLAANVGNQSVASRGLGNFVAALVEPSLEVRVRPGLVQPVAGVVGRLLGLLSSALVTSTDRG